MVQDDHDFRRSVADGATGAAAGPRGCGNVAATHPARTAGADDAQDAAEECRRLACRRDEVRVVDTGSLVADTLRARAGEGDFDVARVDAVGCDVVERGLLSEVGVVRQLLGAGKSRGVGRCLYALSFVDEESDVDDQRHEKYQNG